MDTTNKGKLTCLDITSPSMMDGCRNNKYNYYNNKETNGSLDTTKKGE